MLWSSLKIKIPKDKDTLFQIAAAILIRYQTFEVASLWLWTFWSCQLWRNSQKFGKFLKSSGEWGQPTGKGETAKSCQNFFEDKTQGPFDKYDCLKKTFFIAYLICLYPLSKMNWLTVIEYTIDWIPWVPLNTGFVSVLYYRGAADTNEPNSTMSTQVLIWEDIRI